MALVARDFTAQFHRMFLDGRLFGDEWGPELVVWVYDDNTGEFHGGFVGDNTSLCTGGPRIWNGGIRYETNPDIIKLSPLAQFDRLHRHLARPMTIKHLWCYPIDSPSPFGYWGGGKAKIVQGSYRNRENIILDWTGAMSKFRLPDGRKLLGEAFIGGADAGLNERDLALICSVNGSNLCVTGGPGQVQYETLGVTGLVLVHAAKILSEYLGLGWDDWTTFSICGLGQVGSGVLKWLAHEDYRGPKIVAASNKVPSGEVVAIRNRNGLDPEEMLAALQDKERGILSLAGVRGTERIEPGLEFSEVAGVLVLSLDREEVINSRNAGSTQSTIVLSGTNSGISLDGYGMLYRIGRYAPLDSMVNIGAASVAKSSWHGLPQDECIALAKRAVEVNLKWALEESGRTGKRLDEVARDEVYRRLIPVPQASRNMR